MRLALVALISIAIGCAGSIANPVTLRTPFDEAAYTSQAKPGTGSISGRALIIGPAGGVIFGSGKEVHLDPVTDYSTEWFDEMVKGNGLNRMDPLDPRMLAHRRTTTGDVEGRFRFDHVPAGDYFITCDMWTSMLLVVVGGFGADRVSLGDGEALVDLSVTRREPPPSRTTKPRRPQKLGPL